MLDGLRGRVRLLDVCYRALAVHYRRLRVRVHRLAVRARRVERREVDDLRRWIEHTGNLVHVSVLLFVPLLIGVVTALSNTIEGLSFLLFPPLAAGTYTLFAHPEGRYASPGRFVAGLTLGALCGWLALELAALYVYGVRPAQLEAHAGSAALSVLLTGVATWLLDVEEPAAYSTALLVLVTGTNEFEYVVSVGVSSALVAGVFLAWRSEFYEERSHYLYSTIRGDDHVLVPMRGENARSVATFGARLAAAHEAGKVVLLGIVSEAAADEAGGAALAERGATLADREVGAEADQGAALAGGTVAPGGDRPPDDRWRADDALGGVDDSEAAEPPTDARQTAHAEPPTDAESPAGVEPPTDAEQAADVEAATDAYAAEVESRRLEAEVHRIETAVGVPCEVVVAAGDAAADTVLRAARESNCDLVVTPFESDHGALSGFVRRLFRAEEDVVALRPVDGREEWRQVMVTVRQPGDVAHAMIDFAVRLAGPTGRVSVCTCIERESRRRDAEAMLADLVGQFEGRIETRVATGTVEKFVEQNAPAYDLVVVGASTDRSAASRFLSPPTFERLSSVESDVAVVHQGRP